ncbi:hypothetical protein J5N97_023027 [Dioscorea zingiberensis]|uniref:Uncharacterized protein n=1 Tax=Dioscorea zingiberensis TaxID=325984 RepID=A0A9D5CD55_9LILI|nr:hypothetical protein J5N97_023027 [Dioscorea zingiberensis]
MEKKSSLLLSRLLLIIFIDSKYVTAIKTPDGSVMSKSDQKHTCFGGFTGVRKVLTMAQLHDGLQFSGCKEDHFVKNADEKLIVKTDWEAATDLITLLKELSKKNSALQESPLTIVEESHGGKFAVTLKLSIAKAIIASELKLKFKGNMVSSIY